MTVLAHNHIQSTPDTTWTVTHNLNSTIAHLDVVVLINSQYEKMLPSNIVSQDANTIIVTFTSPYEGRVRVVGTQV